MNKILTILMIFILSIVPLAALAQMDSEVENPNETVEEPVEELQEDEAWFPEEETSDETTEEEAEEEGTQCTEGIGAIEPCYAGFRFVECVNGYWNVHVPTIGSCNVECIEDSDCLREQVCMEEIYKCVVVEQETEGPQKENPIEDVPFWDPTKEQLCKDTGGSWVVEVTTEDVEEAHCDCGENTWNNVEGCQVVEDSNDNDDNDNDNDNDNGSHTSGRGAIRIYREQEAEEETPVEEEATEEVIEETTEQKGFLNQITGFFGAYGDKVSQEASYFLYPLLGILLVGLVIFGVRQVSLH
ncbi:MAG: hypothetical protein ABH849_01135 [Nanoarchaeota archaeon]